MNETLAACLIGFIMDMLLGDPFPWHPVMAIGGLIQRLEKIVKKIFPPTDSGELMAGILLFLLASGIPAAVLTGFLLFLQDGSPIAAFAFKVIICYVLLATKSLKTESMKVYRALAQKDVERARSAVSMIVGRDTEKLSEKGIIRATVETIAENASDGSLAPLFYLILFGPVCGLIYKTVNTMDSMIGYQNDKYMYLGRAAAKMDDLLNYIPARLTAYLMLAAAFLLKMPVRRAYQTYIRDRRKHKSPNSAQTEAVMAGALGVSLAGAGWYFGKRVEKPIIGDALREVVNDDIVAANRLLYVTAGIGLIVLSLLKLQIIALI